MENNIITIPVISFRVFLNASALYKAGENKSIIYFFITRMEIAADILEKNYDN